MQLHLLPFCRAVCVSDVIKMRRNGQGKDEKMNHLAFLSPLQQVQSFPWAER